MKEILMRLEPDKWLELNAKLQTKKNALRTELSELGILKKEGNNTFDKYKYFSEAQYKELFTHLFSKHRLELNFSELEYNTFEGTEKQANGRMPKVEFYLIDCETGFFESTAITGEGIDKGDKAGYKAYTGALKYFLADKFMVATGDDPEKESPDNKMNNKVTKGKASEPVEQKRVVEDKVHIDALHNLMLKKGVTEGGVKKEYGVMSNNLSDEQYFDFIRRLDKMPDKIEDK